jgi:murein DD-endopeptidase MepM/ murein hydrolase activator NlpD
MARRAVLGAISALACALPASAIELLLPADCEVGKTCFVQQYMDHDPSEGVRDYACGSATYDGHDGMDLRIRTVKDVEAGTDVLASAAGTVAGVRDEVPDHLARTDEDRKLVEDRECGNGVLLRHAEGWETQYCHMKKGSVLVAKGDRVEGGQPLGMVGFSGAAAFPHVHLSVRKDGKAVDPFRGVEEGGEECGPGRKPLWTARALDQLAYVPGAILDLGFAEGAIAMEGLELGLVQEAEVKRDSPAIVAWGWAINLRNGYEVVVSLDGPSGELARSAKPLDRNKAQYMAFSGKKRPPEGWTAGRYVARFTVNRDGKPLFSQERTLDMP